MAATRRTQLLMEPDEFRRLRSLARQKKTSVAELIRTAVREKYLAPAASDRKALVKSIVSMNLGDLNWEQVRGELEETRAALP